MYILRIESIKNNAIYRIVQVNPDLSLFDLDMVISTAFMIENEDEAFFQSIQLQSKKNNQFIPLYEEDALFDSLEETVSEWFIKPNDEMHYISEGGIQLKLTLLSITEQNNNPVILEGQGDLFSKSKTVDIAQLNEVLQLERELEDSLFKDLDSDIFSLEPNYLELFEVADELKKLKPWNYFNNEDIVALQVDDMKYFVAVMGAGGQEYGLMIYDELFGYHSLEKIMTDTANTDDFSFELSALTVNYVDRGELENDDYDLIKEQGLSFRGKKNWIAFRTYDPGMLPAQPDAEDTEVMIDILNAMIELTKMRMDGWIYPNVASNEFPLFDVDDEPLQLLGIIKMTRIEGSQIVIDMNDLEIAKIKKKPKNEMEIEFDLFYLPFPISEQGERPIYPLLNIIADQKTGVVLRQETIPLPKDAHLQQLLFWEMLKQVPVLPSKIYVTKDMHHILKPLAKLAGMELVVSKLSNIQKLKKMMFTDLSF